MVVIPEGVKKIKGAFSIDDAYPYPNKVEEVLIPDTVTVISEYSFNGQDGIRVYIPETVAVIGLEDNAPSYRDDNSIFYRAKGTIVTTKGSPAEAYAIREEIPYEIITKAEMQLKMENAERKQNEG